MLGWGPKRCQISVDFALPQYTPAFPNRTLLVISIIHGCYGGSTTCTFFNHHPPSYPCETNATHPPRSRRQVGKCGCQVSASRKPRGVPGTCLPAKSTLDLQEPCSENAMENQRKQGWLARLASYLPFEILSEELKETSMRSVVKSHG